MVHVADSRLAGRIAVAAVSTAFVLVAPGPVDAASAAPSTRAASPSLDPHLLGEVEEPSQSADDAITVYLLDHQMVPPAQLLTIRREVEMIFGEADLRIDWVPEESPRRQLEPDELRLILLPSDGTRWFHGPSNIIGIAPHDDSGIGRNCFIFYRQAVWFRQQTVHRCRSAVAARTEAARRGEEVDAYLDGLAPPDCGRYLPNLTARIVARAAAHEMVHILLNKLDHSEAGLMRLSFDIEDWMADDSSPFRLGRDEIDALQQLIAVTSEGS